MNHLLIAIQNDPDLCLIPQEIHPQVLQSLYIATGCDNTSFFRGLGKVSFVTTFFQYAAFIASGRDPPGSIGMLDGDTESEMAKYSFLRLIGCAYYKQHTSAFRIPTPEALFHSMSGGPSADDNHNQWLSSIRNTARQRVDTDLKTMPSTEALLLHWKRCEWVLKMWKCATSNQVDLPGMQLTTETYTYYIIFSVTDLIHYGWNRDDDILGIHWEVQANIELTKASLDFVLSGCKCKTGCKTRICSCRKKERKCGPSCCCQFCAKVRHTQPLTQICLWMN